MSVGIDFCMAKTLNQAAYAKTYVKFDESLHHQLLDEVGDPPKKYQLLLNLDPYGHRLFSTAEIQELLTICEELVKAYTRPPTDHWKVDRTAQQIMAFAEVLQALCLDALKQNLPICAIGD